MTDKIHGINSEHALDLGAPAPDGSIDLTKPLTEAQFRTALISLTHNNNEGIAQILFHVQHGMQAMVQLSIKMNQTIEAIASHIMEFSAIIDDEEQPQDDSDASA